MICTVIDHRETQTLAPKARALAERHRAVITESGDLRGFCFSGRLDAQWQSQPPNEPWITA